VKLHELKPAPGSRKERTRVGRGIAAGKGKTAGRGTKGQKSRAGASIPAWFEGGQTPLHMRVPKLRGFKRYGRIEYQVVNVGRISDYAAAGRFGVEAAEGSRPSKAGASEPVTVNVEVLRRSGLVGSTRHPVKVLGNGDVAERLFVAADAFTKSAIAKIEAAGGFVQVLAPPKPSRDERSASSGATETEGDAAAAEAVAASPAEDAEASEAPEPAEAVAETPPVESETSVEALATAPESSDAESTESSAPESSATESRAAPQADTAAPKRRRKTAEPTEE
jgi:large subunit ribosomal protein L15